MSRKRKPQLKSLASATEELYWRARVISESVADGRLPAEYVDPMKRLRDALQDFEASRQPVNGHAQGQLQL